MPITSDWIRLAILLIIHIIWIVGFIKSDMNIGFWITIGSLCLIAILSFIFYKYTGWSWPFNFQITFISIYFLLLISLLIYITSETGSNHVGGLFLGFMILFGLPTLYVTKILFFSTWILTGQNIFASIHLPLALIFIIKEDCFDPPKPTIYFRSSGPSGSSSSPISR